MHLSLESVALLKILFYVYANANAESSPLSYHLEQLRHEKKQTYPEWQSVKTNFMQKLEKSIMRKFKVVTKTSLHSPSREI